MDLIAPHGCRCRRRCTAARRPCSTCWPAACATLGAASTVHHRRLDVSGRAAMAVPRGARHDGCAGSATTAMSNGRTPNSTTSTSSTTTRCTDCCGPICTRPGVPVVTTVHGPFTTEMADLFRLAAAAGVGIVAVSHAQRNSAPDLPVMAVIHHGVDVAQFPFGRGDGGYVLFLGRMSPDEGRSPGHRDRSGGRSADRAGCEDVGSRRAPLLRRLRRPAAR